MSQCIIIQTTIPHEFNASPLIEHLLTNHLAGCIQVSDPITSHYRWEGALETSKERHVFIKTVSTLQTAIYDAIHDQHPYDTPEILTLFPDYVDPNYRAWLLQQFQHN